MKTLKQFMIIHVCKRNYSNAEEFLEPFIPNTP